jgi:F0F1-type ATP synthase epsilon subunit
MTLHLISPQATVEHAIAWIELPTHDGSIVVQAGHEPLLLALKPHQQVTFKLKTGKQAHIIVKQGFATISRTEVTLLAEIAE